jgi:hypothetical protein
MVRNLATISSDLDSLSLRDFDYRNADANGLERLAALCDELRLVGDAANCASLLFRTLERLEESDLGSPGPIVHTLETWQGLYEPFLIESVRRKPTPLSVWMLNRILNARPDNWQLWLELLQNAVDHPAASEETKLAAQGFIDYQTNR